MSGKWADSVVELTLPVSGVSSGKRFVAEIGLTVRRKESMAYVLGPGVGGVRPVVAGGGMVATNRRRGDETSLCWAGAQLPAPAQVRGRRSSGRAQLQDATAHGR